MEKIQTKIKIKNRVWDVTFDDPKCYTDTDIDFTENDKGCTVYTGEIYVNVKIRPEQIFATLKHELVHAYVWSYGFYYNKWNEETMAAFIETYCEDIIGDAKELLDYYNKHKKKAKEEK